MTKAAKYLAPLTLLLAVLSGCYGDDARFRVPAGQAPWMVLLVGPSPEGDYICSGTVVAPRWVLTASHCVDQTRPLIISRSGEVVRAKTSYEHPSAVAADWEGGIDPLKKSPADLALINLPRPLVGAKVINLPSRQDKPPPTGTLWGYGPELGPAGRLYWSESRLRACRRGGANLFCLGDEQGRFRACQGDSGGPVIAGSGRERAVWGVNSFALILPIDGCTLPLGESFYAADVQANLNWIEATIGKR